MTALTKDERKKRIKHMKAFGDWLKYEDRTQRWAGTQLEIYHGYVSNLVTGKQVASERVCRIAGRLMGPLNVDTGEPAVTRWTDFEQRNRHKESQKKQTKKRVVKHKQTVKTVKKKPAGRPEGPAAFALRHRLSTAEIEASVSLIKALIKLEPQMTPDAVVEVTKTVIAGFAS